MATTTLCGNCGAALAQSSAPCWRCGTGPSGARRTQYRSPALAAALSIVPGLGHLYLGHWKKGLVYLAAAGGLEMFGFDLDLTAIGAAVGIPLGLGGFGLWAHGIWDAYHLARRMNLGLD